jgi:hypothetical protein
MTQGFDLSNLDTKQDAVLQLLHPTTGEPMHDSNGTPFTVTCWGADSDNYRTAEKKVASLALKQNQRGKPVDMDVVEAQSLKVMRACIRDWHIVLNGELLPCTAETVLTVLTEYPWLREQIDQFINDRSNFLKG